MPAAHKHQPCVVIDVEKQLALFDGNHCIFLGIRLHKADQNHPTRHSTCKNDSIRTMELKPKEVAIGDNGEKSRKLSSVAVGHVGHD